MIPEKLYREILALLPIICVDIIIKNEKGQFLLVQRLNQPLKGEWWVIGGRIMHGETSRDACIRKILQESGLIINKLDYVGFYEELFEQNSFEQIAYHTISLVFETFVDSLQKITLDSQSSHWGWFDELPKKFIVKYPNILDDNGHKFFASTTYFAEPK